MAVLPKPAPSRRRPSPAAEHIPGEPSLWLILFTDTLCFLAMFVFYLHQRGQEVELFDSSQNSLNRGIGVVNTLVLLTSSLLVVYATRALRLAGDAVLARRMLFGAIALGITFVAAKAYEYADKVAAGITPNTNGFYMYYYTLTGLHLAHVLVGIAFLGVLVSITRKAEISPTRQSFFEGSACFWHLVDLLWILIFPLLYLVR